MSTSHEKLKIIIDELKNENLDNASLISLSQFLWVSFSEIKDKLEATKTTVNPNSYCPRCGSSFVREHGKATSARKLCIICKKAFTPEKLNRRRKPEEYIKFLKFMNENKKRVFIIKELKISPKTFNRWKDEFEFEFANYR